jgi:hypothetical protein
VLRPPFCNALSLSRNEETTARTRPAEAHAAIKQSITNAIEVIEFIASNDPPNQFPVTHETHRGILPGATLPSLYAIYRQESPFP